MSIEFTDRYGGRTPSWLRACFRCDAMGCYPEPPDDAARYDMDRGVDDWEFVTCEVCHGTAKVPWLRTLARVPRWLVRGIPFVWRFGVRRSFDPTKTHRESLLLAIRCAYLADLGLWHP